MRHEGRTMALETPIFQLFYFLSYIHEIWYGEYSYEMEQDDINTLFINGPRAAQRPSNPHPTYLFYFIFELCS